MIKEGRAFFPLKFPEIPSGVDPIGLIFLAPPSKEIAGHYVLARNPQLLFNHRPTHGKRYTCWHHMKGFTAPRNATTYTWSRVQKDASRRLIYQRRAWSCTSAIALLTTRN